MKWLPVLLLACAAAAARGESFQTDARAFAHASHERDALFDDLTAELAALRAQLPQQQPRWWGCRLCSCSCVQAVARKWRVAEAEVAGFLAPLFQTPQANLTVVARAVVAAVALLALRVLHRVYLVVRMKKLGGEIAIVTGGGSGIGRLMCLELASLGARVAVWDINEAGADAVRDEIAAAGGEARSYVCDVSEREDVYAAAEAVADDFGGDVTMLINNAGIVSGKSILEADDALMEKTLLVNTAAHFWTTKAVLPAMLENNHGHIVTIASASGYLGVAGLVDYCASKFGAVGFDEALRMEIRKQGKLGVRTLCVNPFFIDTGMFAGAKSRFSFLLPILQPAYVARKTVQAIRTNQQVLCMPRLVYATPLLRALLPVVVFDWVSDLLGNNHSMDGFKGRGGGGSESDSDSDSD